MLPFVHLSQRVLLALGQDEISPDRRTREHLAACARCRSELQQLRALRDAARSLRSLEGGMPPVALLTRVHERIAAGERVLLPVRPPDTRPASRHLRLRALAAAAVVVGVLSLWLARPTRELVAGGTTGKLHVAPAAPRAGDSVTVEYLAPATLAGERTLALRARYRTAWDMEYQHGTRQQTVAVLKRDSDGRFRGAFRLPDSVVFAAMAVEDTSAGRVDSRGRQLWELLVHGADARPSYEALRQQEYDLIGRNMALAFATVRRRASLYPDQPEAWATLYSHERINLGARADSTLPDHHARLARLSDAWAGRPDVPFAVIDGMLSYSAQVTDQRDSIRLAVRNQWYARRQQATEEDLSDRVGARARWWRINSLALKGSDSARVALALAERFWDGAGRRDPLGARLGAQIARLADDSGEVRRRWTDRYASAAPGKAEYTYEEIAQLPALRRHAAERLAALATGLLRRDDTRRPLESTRAEAAAADSVRARQVFGMLGDVLLALGDTAAAHGAFGRAMADGWDPALIRRVAAARLAAGDTVEAVVLLARLAADPGTTPAAVDSFAAIAHRAVGRSRWPALVTEAGQAMRDYFLGTAVRASLSEDPSLADLDGRATTMRHLTAGRVSVVTFWSRTCGPSRMQMPALDSLGAQLERRGMALVPITDEAPSAAVTAFLEELQVHVPVYFDGIGAARRAFGQWATPEYYVLDQSGQVRFRHSSLDVVLSQAVALAAE